MVECRRHRTVRGRVQWEGQGRLLRAKQEVEA